MSTITTMLKMTGNTSSALNGLKQIGQAITKLDKLKITGLSQGLTQIKQMEQALAKLGQRAQAVSKINVSGNWKTASAEIKALDQSLKQLQQRARANQARHQL